jgi:hypothetical protein
MSVAAKTLFRIPSTGTGEAGRRIDVLEQAVGKFSEDAERAFDAGGKWTIRRVSSVVTANPWDFILANPTSAAFTILVPNATECPLARISVKNDSASSATITLRVLDAGTIDGSSTLAIATPHKTVELVSDGREWKTVGASTDLSQFVQIGTDANTTALANRLLYMPTLTANRTVTLPASPADGTFVRLLVSNAQDFTVTVDGNGKSLDDRFFSVTSTYVISNDGELVEFVYLSSPDVWMMAVKSTPVTSRRMRYHTADANTVGLWHGFGNLNDSSGNGFGLTIGAGNERYGEVGYGLQGFVFDGASYLRHNANETALNLVGDMSIEAIVRTITQPSGLGNACIAAYGAVGETGANDNYYWGMFAGNATVGGAPNMAGVVTGSFFWEQGAGVNVQSNGTLLSPLQQPQHWAWVRSGTGLKQYINGFLQSSFTGLTLPTLGGAPTQIFTLGADAAGAEFWTGMVASVKVSNVARSEGYIRRDAIRCLGIGPGILDATGVTN